MGDQLIAQSLAMCSVSQTATLVQAAAAEDSVIRLVPGIGGHVVAGSALGWAWRATKEARPRAEPLETAVAKSVTIGAARSEHHDVALSSNPNGGRRVAVDACFRFSHRADVGRRARCTAPATLLTCPLAPRRLLTTRALFGSSCQL